MGVLLPWPHCVITLDPIPVTDLTLLAKSAIPARLADIALEGSLPPAFVASRSLYQIRSGKPTQWCSTFYIREPDGTIVGGCGFKDAPFNARVELGYAVSPQRRNRGIATAAVAALVSIAFESGEVDEVLAQISELNASSTRVVEKLGFMSIGSVTDQENELLVQWVLRIPSRNSLKPDPLRDSP